MGEVIAFPARRSEQPDDASQDVPPEGSGAEEAEARPGSSEPSGDDVEEPVRWAVPVLDSGGAGAGAGAGAGDAPPERDDRRTRRASNVAMATLARHDASESEVRARLVAKGLDEEEVEAELERLRSVGLIDDTAFAERLVSALRERKGLGDGAIRGTLRSRLVPPSVIDAVLADRVEDEESLQQRVQTVADDRARRLTSLPYEVAERRLTAYLLRKGYGGSTVRAAVRAALDTSAPR